MQASLLVLIIARRCNQTSDAVAAPAAAAALVADAPAAVPWCFLLLLLLLLLLPLLLLLLLLLLLATAAAPCSCPLLLLNLICTYLRKNCLPRNQRKILLPYMESGGTIYLRTNCGTILNDNRDDVTFSRELDRGLGENSMSRELN